MASKPISIRTHHLRVSSQVIFLLVAVLGIFGATMTGFIYPYFFCPASPAACAGCPIWVLEHGTLEIVSGSSRGYMMLAYLFGMFMFIGALIGRSFCGWACPVGSLQDLFSFLKRKLSRVRDLVLLGAASLTMLLFGVLVPHFMSKADIAPVYFLWSGYIGAAGVFLLALSGLLLVRRVRSVIPSVIFIVIGLIPICLNLVSGSGFLEGTPAASFELMGLLGLMFLTVGTIGLLWKPLLEKVPKGRSGNRLDRAARLGKVAVLLLVPPTTWYFDSLAFTDIDPIGGITATVPEMVLNPTAWSGNSFFWYKMVFSVSVIALVAFIDRAWCRYLCPVGALYGPFNKVSIEDIEFKGDRCIHCQKCIRTCPMGINPKEDKTDPECIRCGRCSEVCPKKAQVWRMVNRRYRRSIKV